ncbi:MAG: ABC transporter ATP-binding protein [Acidimicrobiales bacterium]
MSAPLLLKALSKRFGDIVALDGVTLDVGAGELLAVLGRSGSGKTTLLRLVAGLEAPSSGAVWIGGKDATSVSAGERGVAMVFQSHALLPHLSVEENIAFGLRSQRLSRRLLSERVEEAARLAGCGHLLARRPAQLSGGEHQRAALARAVARRPRQLLLDEPFASLDASIRAAVRSDLRAALHRLGATVVHVTHDQAEALTLGDRVAVVDRGRLLQVGSADELLDRPASRAVAEFIGTPGMNIVPVRPGEPPAAGPFPLPLPPGVDPSAVVAGVRPEALRLAGDEDGTPGVVRLVEVVGEQALVRVEAGDTSLVVRTARAGRPAVGTAVRVHAAPCAFHLFDRSSGAAVYHPG